jgi:cyclohexyl-isocyanide hydratase
MKAAFVLFDGLTTLDLIGLYDPVTRLRSMGFRQDFTWDFCAIQPTVTDDRGFVVQATQVRESLGEFDLLLVPGGFGTRHMIADAEFMKWLGTAAPVPLKVSVCTGALLLGAAGWLRDCAATTHPNAYKELAQYCREVRRHRVVDEGNIITGRGVSAALDVGLAVVGRIAGAETRAAIAWQMDYPGVRVGGM